MRKLIQLFLAANIALALPFGTAAYASPKSEATESTTRSILRFFGLAGKQIEKEAARDVEERVARIEAEAQAKTTPNKLRNTSFTGQYFKNLNDELRAGNIEPVLFRDQILNDLIESISTGQKGEGFTMLLGPVGVGKGSIVDTLAHRLKNDEAVRNRLGGRQILRMDGLAIQNLPADKAKKVLEKMRETLKANEGNYILHIEGFQNLVKEPPHDGIDKTITEMAKETKTPVIVDVDRTRTELSTSKAFKDMLNAVNIIDVPNLTETGELIEAMAPYIRKLERQSGTVIPYEAIYHLVMLQKRHGGERGSFGALHKALGFLNAALKDRLTFGASEPASLVARRQELLTTRRSLSDLQRTWGGRDKIRGRYLIDQRALEEKVEKLSKRIAEENAAWSTNRVKWADASNQINAVSRIVGKISETKDLIAQGKRIDPETIALNLEELFSILKKYDWWQDVQEQKGLFITSVKERPVLTVNLDDGGDEGQLLAFIDEIDARLTSTRTEAFKDVPVGLRPEITSDDATRAMAMALGKPASAIQFRPNVMQELRELMKRRMVGQQAIVDDILNLYEESVIGLRPNPVPFFVALFGKSSRGKTFLSKNLAEGMGGTPNSFAHINLAGFTEEHAAKTAMVGAPAGYKGFEEGGQFLTARSKGAKLILLDEINRAHKVVLDYPMGLRDTPIIKNAIGQDIDFTGTGVVAAANYLATIPDSFLRNKPIRQIDTEARKILKAMHPMQFKDETLNRFDRIYVVAAFSPTDRIDMVTKTWKNKYQDLLYTKPVFSKLDPTSFNHFDIHLQPEVLLNIAKVTGAKADATRIEKELQLEINSRISAMVTAEPKQIQPGDFINVEFIDGQYRVNVMTELRDAPIQKIDEVLAKERRQLTAEMTKGLNEAEANLEESNQFLTGILNKIVNDQPLTQAEDREIKRLGALERNEGGATGGGYSLTSDDGSGGRLAMPPTDIPAPDALPEELSAVAAGNASPLPPPKRPSRVRGIKPLDPATTDAAAAAEAGAPQASTEGPGSSDKPAGGQ